MVKTLRIVFFKFSQSFLNVLPIILVITFFQIAVIQKPFPHLQETLFGFVLVIVGLFIFIQGLEQALFPLGERLAVEFAVKGNVFWIVLFGFTLGFATTIAEPALTVITQKAGKIAAEAGVIDATRDSITDYVWGLRMTTAFAVGLAGAIGVVRIIKGWPLVIFILAGYSLIVLVTLFAPKEIIGIAYDAGGITTSTITVPLITALGIGLASTIRGRNPIIDGFGLIALASLTPILFVMLYGIFIFGPS